MLAERFELFVDRKVGQRGEARGSSKLPVSVSDYSDGGGVIPVTNFLFILCAAQELANAYVELNDPDEQELRFRTQAQNKEDGDDEVRVVAKSFFLLLRVFVRSDGVRRRGHFRTRCASERRLSLQCM